MDGWKELMERMGEKSRWMESDGWMLRMRNKNEVDRRRKW